MSTGNTRVVRQSAGVLLSLLLLMVVGGCASTPATVPAAAAPAPREDVGERAARVALQQVGTPYRYGGSTPSGFDCSGLVQYAYRLAGVSVPRTTAQQWDSSRTVSRAELRTGDLLFFRIAGKMQHVGMYIGDGEFVHAPSSGRQVTLASLNADFYREALLRTARPH